MRSWKCMVFTKVKNASRNLVSQGFIAGTLPGFCPTLGRPLELGGLVDTGDQKSLESSMESYISRLVGGHPVPPHSAADRRDSQERLGAAPFRNWNPRLPHLQV